MRVGQNLFIGRELRGRLGVLRQRQMIVEARAMLANFGLDVEPTAPMGQLNLASSQMIEIMKATSRDARIVLMDEPSSPPSRHETDRLFQVIRQLRDQGVCILYISHRMEEIEAIADTVSVLRDGQLVRHAPAHEMTERQIIAEMVGRDLQTFFPDQTVGEPGPVVLDVQDLRVEGTDSAVSFSVRRGEILGSAAWSAPDAARCWRRCTASARPTVGSP